MYDTISAKEFIDFLELKVTDNFNISKMNVKFKHQFTAPFWKTSPLVTLMHAFITDIDYIH